VRILVVDDEPSVRDALDRALRMDGYRVQLASDGTEALDALAHTPPDAIVLDVLMPGPDGLEVCRRLRAAGDRTPVLMLTARDAVPDRVKGLDAGADDYLVKPFALEELGARLRALLRRSGGPIEDSLRYAGIDLDPAGHTVHRGERLVELTRTEFLLLELLMNHPRQVLTRTQIFEHVWGYDFGPSSNSLEVYVGYLRRKLEAGGEPRLIHTVRGVGYVLREK
jgi:two-component system, OmpR family, response regulator MprA